MQRPCTLHTPHLSHTKHNPAMWLHASAHKARQAQPHQCAVHPAPVHTTPARISCRCTLMLFPATPRQAQTVCPTPMGQDTGITQCTHTHRFVESAHAHLARAEPCTLNTHGQQWCSSTTHLHRSLVSQHKQAGPECGLGLSNQHPTAAACNTHCHNKRPGGL
jgi:hypothetical protein